MNQITEPDESVSQFGLEFNYALWTQNTNITLVNVPWNNDYRDIVKFADRAALNAYIDSLETSGISLDNISYLKPTQPVRIDVPFNVAYRYNYLRATNGLQPIAGDVAKQFYYFITDVRYIAPNTTELVLQLDVWQTFGFDLTFGNSYIERGHIGIANEKAFDNYGRDYLTIPEGLDLGSEYVQITRKNDTIFNKLNMDILVVSTVALEEDPGTVTNPKLSTAKGGRLQGIPSGASYYIFSSVTNFTNFLDAYSDKPWVTQGIISISVLPDISRYNYYVQPITGVPGLTASKLTVFGENASRGNYRTAFNNWRDSAELLNYIPERYRHLRKFFTYPYMAIEMTTFTGTPIILKPECWADDNATIHEKISLNPPNQKIAIWPRRYNAQANSDMDSSLSVGDSVDGTTEEFFDDGGDYLDKATMIANFPKLAIVNNMAIGYMAANANSIAFQNQSADWSQQRALASNQVTYDQQTAAIETAKNINALERSGMASMVASDQLALLQSTAAQGASGVIGGALGAGMGGLGGGVGGIAAGAPGVIGGVQSQIMGGINAGISIDRSNRNLSTSQTVSRGTNVAQTNQQALIRDTNKSLADWAAKGDYANTIAGINAKVQDIQLTQPSTAGQVGGEAFNIANNAAVISLRWKMIGPAEMRVVGEYWLRYGYSVRQFAQIPASLQVMSKFTYWKLSETYIISASMPEGFKQAIRGIFEKGVTVWNDPADIGAIDIADNVPLEGITL